MEGGYDEHDLMIAADRGDYAAAFLRQCGARAGNEQAAAIDILIRHARTVLPPPN